MQIKHIPLSHIDSGNHYCYHMNLDLPELRQSIQMQGIQMPLWLIRSEKVKIVDGFRRFYMAQQLGIPVLPAILFDVNDIKRIYLSALSLNSSQDELSVIEKIMALKISRIMSNSNLNNQVLNILNLHFVQSIEEILNYYATMPSWMREYLHRIKISLKSLNRLLKYTPIEYECWLKMANDLNFKGTELIQLLEVIHEICRRDEISARELWKSLTMDSLLERRMTPQHLSSAIKKHLHQARFPYLSKINQVIEDKVNQLRKSYKVNMNIDWDRSLENGTLKFHFTLNESMAIEKIITFLQNSQNRRIISDIFVQMENLPSLKR